MAAFPKPLRYLYLFVTVYLFSFAASGQHPFLLQLPHLQASRDQIKAGNADYLKALEQLRSEADSALERGPYSVTDKLKAPPGGSKNDYMSVGPYWWPDPEKPDGLPYIRKDGQVNPERYTIQDAAYHDRLCNDVLLLGVAWYFTGEKKYPAQADRLLRTWFINPSTKMNPHLNYGQAIPGRTDGRGIGLIDTRELVYLIDGVQLLMHSQGLPADTYNGVREWYKTFLQWMLTSPIGLDEADQHNNHGTYYDVQTIAMALFTDQSGLARRLVETVTKARIESQLSEDGRQPHELARTLSWSYSSMNLQGFFELAFLAENVGIDLWNYESPSGKGIKKAFLWMLPFAQQKQSWEYPQIKPPSFNAFQRMTGIAARKFQDLPIAIPDSPTKPGYLNLLTQTLY